MDNADPLRRIEHQKTLRTVTRVGRVVAAIAAIWLLVDLVVLGLGFVLKLFGANPASGFTEFAYRSLDRVMDPFRGIFPGANLGANSADVEAVLDTSILFAMLVYGIVFMVVRAVIAWLDERLRIGQLKIESAEHELRMNELRAKVHTYDETGAPVDRLTN